MIYIDNFEIIIKNNLKQGNLKKCCDLLEDKILELLKQNINNINDKYRYKSMYQIVDFANNNFDYEKKEIVNAYYKILQSDSDIENDIENLMEIYYLVKKW